jgi:hypothetical protein
VFERSNAVEITENTHRAYRVIVVLGNVIRHSTKTGEAHLLIKCGEALGDMNEMILQAGPIELQGIMRRLTGLY